jgi:hypothetical protein
MLPTALRPAPISFLKVVMGVIGRLPGQLFGHG